MKKILVSLSIIGVVAVVAVGATVAYFGDVETSAGNTMTAGTVDLKIDLRCPPPGCNWGLRDLDLFGQPSFFNRCDIKPGDSGEVTISWHVYNNNAWAKLKFADIAEAENGCTNPETKAGDTTCGNPGLGEGELDDYLTFTAWMDQGQVAGWQCPPDSNGPCTDDPMEGDNILNGVETPIIKDISVNQIIAQGGIPLPEELQGSTTYYLGLQWNILPSVGNIIQTDSLTGKIIMEVVQSRNNPRPSFVNGGFETGDFTGWNVNYPALANVVTSYTSDQGTVYGPKEGSKFAVLNAGAGTGVYTIVSQTVNLKAGQKLAGWAAFDAKDYLPYDDDSAVVIVSGGPFATPWQKAVHDVGNYGETPWQHWTWTAPADGAYTLELKVRNVGDNILPSTALFDAHIIEP